MIHANLCRRTLMPIAFVVAVLATTRAKADLIPLAATYALQFGGVPIPTAGGNSPGTVSGSTNFYGLTASYTFGSSYVSNSLTQGASATLDLAVGGTPGDLQMNGNTTVTSQLNYLIPPGNEFFFGVMNGLMTYHLAAGDSLFYNISGVVEATGDLPTTLYVANVNGQVSTPGDGSVDFSFPESLFASLIKSQFATLPNLYDDGASILTSDFGFDIEVLRGAGETDVTTVNIDPGVTVQVSPNAVPEPSSLSLLAVAVVLTTAGAWRRAVPVR
jgi:hypothetical protein